MRAWLVSFLVGCATSDNDWRKMCALFDGEFDNYDQLEDLRCGLQWGGCDNETHSPLHSIFRRVDDKVNLTGIHEGDGCILYVEQFQDQSPDNVYRQKLYVIAPNLTMSLWGFANPKAVLGAYKNPNLLNGLASPAVYDLKGCEVNWHWDVPSGMFRGKTNPSTCSLMVNGTKHTITDDNTLSDDFVTIHERWTPPIAGTNKKLPEILYRWRSAEQAYYQGFFYGVNPANTSEVAYKSNITLFDVGQVHQVVIGNISWIVELAVCHYQADHKGAEVLKLAVYREGFDQAMAYTWAKPGSPSLGLTYRDITASTVIVQTEFRLVQNELSSQGVQQLLV